MKRRILLLVILLLMAAAGAWFYFQKPETREAPIKRAPLIAPELPMITIEEMRAFYRLKPDRRFLLAMGDLHHLLTTEKRQIASAEFKSEKWEISYRGQVVGTLPEFPDYQDWMDLLVQWGATLPSKLPKNKDVSTNTLEKLIRNYDGLQAVKEADRIWGGSGNSYLLPLASRAYLILYTQAIDLLRFNETLPARAIALMAASKVLPAKTAQPEECMLAQQLGYTASAKRLAEKLPESSSLRMMISGSFDALRKRAYADTDSAEARYLYFLRLADARKKDEWVLWQENYFPDVTAPTIQAALLMNHFDLNPTYSVLAMRMALEEMQGSPLSEKHENTHQLIQDFDSGLKRHAAEQKGILWDSEAFQAYYQGLFYSGLYRLGGFNLDQLSSREAADSLVKRIGEFPSGPGHDFQLWYAHLTQSKQGKNNISTLKKDLVELSTLGAPPLLRMFEDLAGWAYYQDPLIFLAVRDLVEKLDSRPGDCLSLGDIALKRLNDLKLTEQLYGSVMRVAPTYNLRGASWFASYQRDVSQIESILSLPEITPVEISNAIWWLSQDKDVPPEQMRNVFQKAAAMERTDYWIRGNYIRYLQDRKEYDEAIRVIKDWLNYSGPEQGFDYIHACVDLSHLYSLQGKYDIAWSAVEPVVDSWQGDALSEGVLALDHLGKTEEALKLAYEAVDRYPDAWGNWADLLEVLWRHGRYTEAPKALDKYPAYINLNDWCWRIGQRFIETFASEPDDKAMLAFVQLLTSRNYGKWMATFAKTARKEKRPALGYRMVMESEKKHFANIYDLLGAYSCMRESKGSEAAFAWLQKEIPAQKVSGLCFLVFQAGEDQLLWDLAPHPEKFPNPEWIWLTRAAAAARSENVPESWKKQLMDYYSGKAEILSSYQKRNHEYQYREGQFLMGVISEQDLLSAAKNSEQLCDIAYFIGLKHHAAGDYENASDWYRLAVETRQRKEYEYMIAFDTLETWSNVGHSLRILAQDKVGLTSP